MGQHASSPPVKSLAVLAVVAVVAAAANLIFGHALHLEPMGLFGFGLFCIAYGAGIASLSRPPKVQTTALLGEGRLTAESGPTEPVWPVIVREPKPRQLEMKQLSLRPRHALTVDLEDYFHTEVAAQGISFASWEQQPSRIEASTHRLLDMLDGSQTQGTFFVLGWVAKRYPRLIQEVARRGHEIGCHSLDHRLVSRMRPAEFLDNTRHAKDLIESIIHEPIRGYRAPCFSITPGCEWAFDVLARLGFSYDSSVHPVHHPVYGNHSAPRTAYAVAEGRLMEFPIATWKVAGRNLSVGGGAYLRLLPYQYIHRGLKAWEKQMQGPAMLYLHPWEIDPYQPYIPLSLGSKIRQTWGTTTMEDKLQHLLRQFQFAPVREVHKNLLEGKGHRWTKSNFLAGNDVEQVAG